MLLLITPLHINYVREPVKFLVSVWNSGYAKVTLLHKRGFINEGFGVKAAGVVSSKKLETGLLNQIKGGGGETKSAKRS